MMGISNIFNNISNFVKEEKEKHDRINQIIDNSNIFTLDNKIDINEDNIVIGNIYEYSEMCPYINIEYAKKIDSIIPFNEVVLKICQVIQKKDNKSYILVFTDLRIIVMDNNMYKNYNYNEITNFYIIDKGLMSQIITFNDIVLEIDVSEDELNVIYNLVTNMEYRNKIVTDMKKYLCGIVPIYQTINKFKSGISIDNNRMVVFHDRKINNYLCKYDDIANYELMEDNTSVLRKKGINYGYGVGSIKQECSKISLRVTLNNGQVFEILILEPSTFNSSYSHKDSTYIKYYNFTKAIIDKLDSLNLDK